MPLLCFAPGFLSPETPATRTETEAETEGGRRQCSEGGEVRRGEENEQTTERTARLTFPLNVMCCVVMLLPLQIAAYSL